MSALTETMENLEKTCTELGQAWDTFQADMRAWKKNQEKNAANAEVTEKVEQLSNIVAGLDGTKAKLDAQLKDIAEQKSRIDEIEEALNTPIITKNGDTIVPKKVKEAKDRYLRTCDQSALAEYQDYVQKSMNLTQADQGGLFFTITAETGIDPMVREICPMRQICDVRKIGTTVYTFRKKTGNTSAGWVGEMETRPETTAPTYAMQEIIPQECYAQPYVSQTMLEDADFDVERELNEDLAETFGELENVAFISGNGVKKPRGLLSLTFSATPSAEQVLEVKTGASGDWAASDPHVVLLGVAELLKERYQGNARFMMSRARVAEVMKFVDGNKLPIWQPSFQVGTPSTLVGYPVTRNEHMPAKAANSRSVVFGDFKAAYRIVDRLGTSIMRDPYTNVPFIKFYTRRRVGGDVVRPEAYLAFKFIN